MKRFNIRSSFTSRHGGGLFLGLRWCYPVAILYPNKESWITHYISIGLLVWTIRIEIRTKKL